MSSARLPVRQLGRWFGEVLAGFPKEAGELGVRVELLPQDIVLPLLGSFLLPDLHFGLIVSHRTAPVDPDMPLTVDSIKIHDSV